MVHAIAEPHQRQCFLGLSTFIVAPHAGIDKRKHHILKRAGARQQVELLKDKTDFLAAD